jgi:hypothetical protein
MERLRAGFLESNDSADIGVSCVGRRFGSGKPLLTGREALSKCAKLSGRYPMMLQLTADRALVTTDLIGYKVQTAR